MHCIAVLLFVLLATSCSDGANHDTVAATAADSQAAHVQEVVAAGGVVDSILPINQHLERFRASVPRVDTLVHASPSARQLLDRWASAIAARDTVALNEMLINRAEFAWLYYPDSRMSKPPYEAPPELLWGQLLASSDQGARKLLTRFGGGTLTIVSFNCPRAAQMEGENRLHEECITRLESKGARIPPNRLFGTIIERGGRFKFVGYANRL